MPMPQASRTSMMSLLVVAPLANQRRALLANATLRALGLSFWTLKRYGESSSASNVSSMSLVWVMILSGRNQLSLVHFALSLSASCFAGSLTSSS
ncbi:hypothetical protein BDN72DRAFT_593768 [Pluteus cervinus]|uniref:Uncharacterized protein n=1 Tax=Pluteus cervinus TaxID=181527 RepID=A0ACD3A1I9_9AGAR|nr:hypothetical protein BDN72DRAFT_593768 [Pluteus cervinus]